MLFAWRLFLRPLHKHGDADHAACPCSGKGLARPAGETISPLSRAPHCYHLHHLYQYLGEYRPLWYRAFHAVMTLPTASPLPSPRSSLPVPEGSRHSLAHLRSRSLGKSGGSSKRTGASRGPDHARSGAGPAGPVLRLAPMTIHPRSLNEDSQEKKRL